MDDPLQAPISYRTASGSTYECFAQACDWDLDHPDAQLFTFVISRPGSTFEKVIAVEPEEVAPGQGETPTQAALRAAQAKLFQKLEAGNEADEPTPLE